MMSDLTLCGIPQLQRVNIDSHKVYTFHPDGSITGPKEEENLLVTSGVNLMAVLSEPGVDSKKTYSNDVVETLETLGIEACRGALLR